MLNYATQQSEPMVKAERQISAHKIVESNYQPSGLRKSSQPLNIYPAMGSQPPTKYGGLVNAQHATTTYQSVSGPTYGTTSTTPYYSSTAGVTTTTTESGEPSYVIQPGQPLTFASSGPGQQATIAMPSNNQYHAFTTPARITTTTSGELHPYNSGGGQGGGGGLQVGGGGMTSYPTAFFPGEGGVTETSINESADGPTYPHTVGNQFERGVHTNYSNTANVQYHGYHAGGGINTTEGQHYRSLVGVQHPYTVQRSASQRSARSIRSNRSHRSQRSVSQHQAAAAAVVGYQTASTGSLQTGLDFAIQNAINQGRIYSPPGGIYVPGSLALKSGMNTLYDSKIVPTFELPLSFQSSVVRTPITRNITETSRATNKSNFVIAPQKKRACC